MLTVAWHKMCSPIMEGGVGLRSLRTMNKAALCYELLSSSTDWVALVKARFLRHNKPIGYHKSSSIWGGLKQHYDLVFGKVKWLIGDGVAIKFWHDCWLSDTLVNILGIPVEATNFLNDKVADFIIEGR